MREFYAFTFVFALLAIAGGFGENSVPPQVGSGDSGTIAVITAN